MNQLARTIRSENDEVMTPIMALKPGTALANRTVGKAGLQTPINPMRRKLGNLSNTPRVLSGAKNTGSKNGPLKKPDVFKKPNTPTLVVPSKSVLTNRPLPVVYEEVETAHPLTKEEFYEDVCGPTRDALISHIEFMTEQVCAMPFDEAELERKSQWAHLSPEEFFSDIL